MLRALWWSWGGGLFLMSEVRVGAEKEQRKRGEGEAPPTGLPRIRNRHPVGAYSRHMSRALWWS